MEFVTRMTISSSKSLATNLQIKCILYSIIYIVMGVAVVLVL